MSPVDVRMGARSNKLLAVLPETVLRGLRPQLEPITLDVARVLYEPGQPIRALYFPQNAVVSLVTPLEEGAIVEVATIGNEGVVGVPLGAGSAPATVRAISLVAGDCLRMSRKAFALAVATQRSFAELIQRYEQALFGQIAQAAACNRLHPSDARLSRWLLMSHDRVGRPEFAITQEFLAQMLGSRRATVTVSAGVLQRAGLIHYRRGHMRIVNRQGLENASCSCYRAIRTALARVSGADGAS